MAAQMLMFGFILETEGNISPNAPNDKSQRNIWNDI